MDFTIYDDEGVEPFLSGLDPEDRRGGSPIPPNVSEKFEVFIILRFLLSSFFLSFESQLVILIAH